MVNARMATQTPAQNASASGRKNVTMPATGSSFQCVARSVTKPPWPSGWTGNTLMPIDGRNEDTNSTATITANVALGTDLPGFFASSDMLEMVSMPVYVTIAIEMLARKLPQVGATPQWMLWITTGMLRSSQTPSVTSTTCVPRSSSASTRFSRLD